MARKDRGYSEQIENSQAARPEPWPGIPGRSKEREAELPTGTAREEQAEVTEAQRKLEQEEEDSEERREPPA